MYTLTLNTETQVMMMGGFDTAVHVYWIYCSWLQEWFIIWFNLLWSTNLSMSAMFRPVSYGSCSSTDVTCVGSDLAGYQVTNWHKRKVKEAIYSPYHEQRPGIPSAHYLLPNYPAEIWANTCDTSTWTRPIDDGSKCRTHRKHFAPK